MIHQLTPIHQVQTDYVSMVALTTDRGEMVCRVYWHGGEYWEIRGEYAEVAWVGWMSFWRGGGHGGGHKPIEVKVPSQIIREMQKRNNGKTT
jgi:hypothetical protein